MDCYDFLPPSKQLLVRPLIEDGVTLTGKISPGEPFLLARFSSTNADSESLVRLWHPAQVSSEGLQRLQMK